MARYEIDVREVPESNGGSGCGTMLFWCAVIIGAIMIFGR